MIRLAALTRRELLAYFYAPVPYLVMFVFLVITWFVIQMSLAGRLARVDFMPVFEFLAFIPEGARGNPSQDLYVLRRPAR